MNRCLLSITRALWWTILLDMTRRYIPQQECRMHLPISWNCTAMHHYALWIVGVCFVYFDCHVFCYWRGAATAGTHVIGLGTANAFAIFVRSGCNSGCIKYNWNWYCNCMCHWLKPSSTNCYCYHCYYFMQVPLAPMDSTGASRTSRHPTFSCNNKIFIDQIIMIFRCAFSECFM